MLFQTCFRVLCITAVIMCMARNVEAEPIAVYLLGGQSNMQGLGQKDKLTDEQKAAIVGAKYWNGAAFVDLDPMSVTTAAGPTQFGPEIGFARTIASQQDAPSIYIVKHWRSGTGLDAGWHGQNWLGDPPGQNRVNFHPGHDADDPNRGVAYRDMLNRFQAAITHLNESDVAYEIKGFIWVQGEQDAKHATSAGRYAESLKHLSDRLHEDLGLDHPLPFIYAQVLGMPDDDVPARFPARDALHQSMRNADTDAQFRNAFMVSTADLSLVDDVHYDTASQLELGERLGQAMIHAQSALPEPSSLLLLTAGATLLMRRVRLRS